MSETETGYVYTLNDPRTDDPKYVGATVDPEKRLYTHKHGATNDDVSQWIEALSESGLDPVLTVVSVTNIEALGNKELEVIERLSEEWELFNRRNDAGYSKRGPSSPGESKRIVVHDSVNGVAESLAEDRGISKKEAVRDVFKEAGYDV